MMSHDELEILWRQIYSLHRMYLAKDDDREKIELRQRMEGELNISKAFTRYKHHRRLDTTHFYRPQSKS